VSLRQFSFRIDHVAGLQMAGVDAAPNGVLDSFVGRLTGSTSFSHELSTAWNVGITKCVRELFKNRRWPSGLAGTPSRSIAENSAIEREFHPFNSSIRPITYTSALFP
jgi:hypothetical protein